MMCALRRSRAIFVLSLAASFLSSCTLVRVRPIARGTHPASQTLLTATKAELIKRILDNYELVQSLSATVDLQASLGSVYKGQIKDYSDITAYIDFRKPGDIRVVGLLPVVRSTAFNMVSDGQEFKVHMVVQKKFIVGKNDAPGNSKNKFENIRPQTFLSALLVAPVDTKNELSLLADDTTESGAYYQLAVIRKIGDDIYAHRRITFDRVNFQIVEQREYDESASIVSLTKYAEYKIYNNVRFPSKIEIARPKDEYGLSMVVEKLEMNKPVADTKFVLTQPEGTELQAIGGTPPK